MAFEVVASVCGSGGVITLHDRVINSTSTLGGSEVLESISTIDDSLSFEVAMSFNNSEETSCPKCVERFISSLRRLDMLRLE